MNMNHKSFSPKVKSIDETEGKATLLVSVFNVPDFEKDIVLPGAYTKTLTERTPKFVMDHDWSSKAKLGKVISGRETGEGLEVDVEFNLEKQAGKEAFSDLLFDPEGAEFSIGYRIPKGGAEHKDGFRYLKEIELFEVSQVLIGMNPETRLVAAKSETATDETDVEIEAEVEPEVAPFAEEDEARRDAVDDVLAAIEEMMRGR